MSQSQAQYIKQYISFIQKWMNENIKTNNPVSSSAIFASMKKDLPETINQNKFQVALSAAVREGLITGFCAKKGKYGGYIPISFSSIDTDESNESTESKVEGINLGRGFSIIGSDNNWSINRPNGVKLYYPKLNMAFQKAAQLMLESELLEVSCQLSELKNIIEEAEKRIISELTNISHEVIVHNESEVHSEDEEE